MSDVERKSELRVALEGALFKRASKGKPGEVTYGVDTWLTANPGEARRWMGSAWFRDHDGLVVRVTWQGAKTGQELGDRLLASIELIPERT